MLPKLLVIDNYDSFTFNLVQMFRQYPLNIRVRRSDKITVHQAFEFSPDYIVISPGPKDPAHAGVSVALIRAFQETVPILGVFLVFLLLIGPAVVVKLFTSNWTKRIIWSWGVGFICCFTGIILSYVFDISNGPAIVCILGVLALAMCMGVVLSKSNH